MSVLPDCHESFASLRAILTQLRPLAPPEQLSAFAKLDGYLRDACLEPERDGHAGHGQLLTDSVTFAIMRRISRESVYTARLIDLAARTINSVLANSPGCTHVHVAHVDRLDRPSLKALARAMLLLEPEHRFAWIWHSTSDPLSIPPSDPDDLFATSRGRLLSQLVSILSPSFERGIDVAPLVRPATRPAAITPYDVSAALVVQNYDACFFWTESLLRSDVDAEVVEGLRLQALAAVNVGLADEALGALRRAESLAGSSARKAHLAYLQGLIEAKRCYDLASSTAHYERGLAALDAGLAGAEDLPLERGWLLNGLALNEAIRWRRDPAAAASFSRSFALEREAFDLVRDGDHPARVYLRFNLLANSAFLIEMDGQYDQAIDIFRKAFDFGVEASPAKQRRWRSTLNYRIGMLHHRAGRLEEAYRLLQDAAEQEETIETWATQERILRGLGTIALASESFADAADIYSRGLTICREARSAEGTREHARGIITALVSQKRERQAQDVADSLAADEALEVMLPTSRAGGPLRGDGSPSSPSSKLPAYIPEIDLEGIPMIDMNRFLTREGSRQAPMTPWKT